MRHVPLQSLDRPRRTDRRSNLAESGARARHDAAPPPDARPVARTEPYLRRVPETFRRSSEAGQRDSAAAGRETERGLARDAPRAAVAEEGSGDPGSFFQIAAEVLRFHFLPQAIQDQRIVPTLQPPLLLAIQGLEKRDQLRREQGARPRLVGTAHLVAARELSVGVELNVLVREGVSDLLHDPFFLQRELGKNRAILGKCRHRLTVSALAAAIALGKRIIEKRGAKSGGAAGHDVTGFARAPSVEQSGRKLLRRLRPVPVLALKVTADFLRHGGE